MSWVSRFKHEVQIWRAVWQNMETYLDRVLGQRDDDATHRDKMAALLDVLSAISEERRARTGRGLLAPIEIAEKRGEPAKHELAGKGTPDKEGEEGPDLGRDRRMPGSIECEAAVALPRMSLVGLPAELDADTLSQILPLVITASTKLFDRYDEQEHGWVSFKLPEYDFSWSSGNANTYKFKTDTTILFPEGKREEAVNEGKTELPTWQSICDDRLENSDTTVTIDSNDNGEVSTAAGRAKKACDAGAKAIDDHEDALDEAGLSSLTTPLAGEFKRRSTLYQKMSSGQSLSTTERVSLESVQKMTAFEAEAFPLVDEAVDSRISYPDGSLRMLRTLEWSFRLHWNARLPWFTIRRTRFLQPLLELALDPFLTSIARLITGQHTLATISGKLASAAPMNSRALTLEPRNDGLPRDLSTILPGHIVVLGGSRHALAVLLGEDDPDTLGRQRVRITPLRVSIAGGVGAGGIAGLVEQGTHFDSGPANERSQSMLLSGHAGDHPEHDGVPEQIVALWSKLSLVLGTAKVANMLGSRAGQSLPQLSMLGSSAKLPIFETIAPRATELVLDTDAVQAVFNLNAPNATFARPGELLLLTGTGKSGQQMQGVVEVLEVVRMDAKDLEAGDPVSPPPLARPVCLDCAGDRIVVRVTDTPFEEDLSNAKLHRGFEGFGGPSLATKKLLPGVVDPASKSGDLDRYAELKVACRFLEEWFGA